MTTKIYPSTVSCTSRKVGPHLVNGTGNPRVKLGLPVPVPAPTRTRVGAGFTRQKFGSDRV